MKVLLSWLREFAPIEGDPFTLADELSALGMAVEAVDVLGAGLEGVIVARVLSTRPHPQADRIQLVDVDVGDGDALQICCGAFNMAPGDLVPLATLGTTMPDGRLIERRKLRGEWSNGMLCSATELGLGADAAGILVLPDGLATGTDLREAMGISHDVLYDLDLTGNRPDALSVAGVARDLAAWLKVPFAVPGPEVGEDYSVDGASAAAVEIIAPDLCGRFAARLLRGVKVQASPSWLANRLVALGMRPINNVVDISNYVMLELGQPSHTFDLARIEGRRLAVRWARDGEQLVTLDGQTRTFTTRDGVIADGRDEVVSIAGVMGGQSTEISDATADVLLEMAWWDPMSIARTARRLALRSEASTRFERGTDPAVIDVALRRFAQLLAPSGATLAAGTIDVPGDLPTPAVVRVRTNRVNAMLGTELSAPDIRGYLEPIGFACAPVGDDHDVTVPTFRMVDSSTEVDVIEEVARHHGYARIAKTVPRPEDQAGGLTPVQWDRRSLRAALVGFGYTEVMPLPFLAPGDLARAGLGADGIRVTNPLVADESIMRTSLRPGILKTLAYNASHRNVGLSFFEIGHVYLPTDRTAELPDEREHLAVALSGREAPAAVEAWQVVVDALGVAGAVLEMAEPEGMHPGRSARALVDGVAVGLLGEVDPAALDAYGVPERVAWLEIDLTTLLALPRGANRYRPISRFPSSDIDLAFEVAEETPAAAVDAALRSAAAALLADLRLFDVYRGDRVAEGSRSLAYRLRLQATDRTLTDAEIAEVRAACIAAVEGGLAAKLRG